MSLEKAYFEIKRKFENFDLEPFSIIKSVDDHRNFWRPDKVKVLLLAESHVYTSITEHDNIMRYDGFQELVGCPKNYVKLVYCLGYGENNLVNLRGNSGTWQFWEIFVSCLNQNFHSEKGKILKENTDFHQRLRNKIFILEKLKEKGIWLVDASIVAVNATVKLSPKIKRMILKISWEHHISKVISETQPEKIIVIGKGVSKYLEDELNELKNKINIPDSQHQPQSHSLPEGYYEKYYELCNS